MCQRGGFRFFLRRWRVWIRPAVMVSYMIVIVVMIPFLVVKMENDGYTEQNQAWLIGGMFSLMALPITFWEITQHLIHYTKPYLQKHIIRILWMVPIYALNAWLGLTFPAYAIYMDTLRSCYEAYVIYNFMAYLLSYLNAEMDLEATLELKPQTKHLFPLCCLRSWEMGREFVHNCKHGILQYTVVRPITTVISLICELAGVYGEGEFRANNAYPYMVAVNNVSQFAAMYCLVLFYKANREELKAMHPIGKFLCIKSVVFFSFFQGVIISILVFTGVISNAFGTTDKHDIKDISASLQNFLICIEMFLASVAHHYAFTHKPYVDSAAEQQPCCAAFFQMWDVSDVQRDVREHINVVRNSVKRRIGGGNVYKHTGETKNECSKLITPSDGGDEAQSPVSEGTSGIGNLHTTYQSMGDSGHDSFVTAVDTSAVITEPSQSSVRTLAVGKETQSEDPALIDFTDMS